VSTPPNEANPPGSGSGAVDLRGISQTYDGDRPVEALVEVTLTVDDGDFVAVVGPSGCGKSTILRILAGLITPTAGEARVGGVDVIGRPGAVALHPQRDLLLPWLRTLGNATLGAEVCGVERADARRQAAELLGRFGLDGFERSWPAQLSGGMRQRLALLRTFLIPRPVLLLDEPLGALDALTRRDLQGWLESVWLQDRRTTLLVTHDIDEALRLADRVVVLSPRPGRIVHVEPCPGDRPRPATSVVAPAVIEAKARILDALGSGA
jgi:ABC-type nitrate/sulfonate/bicarbonate transport system ATPase subunit